MSVLEKEIGFDIKVIKGAVKRGRVTPEQDAETLHAQLVLRRVPAAPPLPGRAPGNHPLGSDEPRIATRVAPLHGSIRNALKMMLEDSEQPIFGEVVHKQLPPIAPADFWEYLDFQFEATGKPADEEALDHLIALTDSHPRRTQQLAWETWNDEGEFNELRALQLLADRGGRRVTSREQAAPYGFSSHSRVPTALERLRGRGLVEQREGS